MGMARSSEPGLRTGVSPAAVWQGESERYARQASRVGAERPDSPASSKFDSLAKELL